MSVHEQKLVCATLSKHHVYLHSFSLCSHANAVDPVCHINVVLHIGSNSVGLEFVYVCALVFACLNKWVHLLV